MEEIPSARTLPVLPEYIRKLFLPEGENRVLVYVGWKGKKKSHAFVKRAGQPAETSALVYCTVDFQHNSAE